MRCHICDAGLTPKSIQYNREHQEWDPCGTCLEAISEIFEGKSEEEIDWELAEEMTPEELAEWNSLDNP